MADGSKMIKKYEVKLNGAKRERKYIPELHKITGFLDFVHGPIF
jgi:hypothetical protein